MFMRSILCVPANKPLKVEKSAQYDCDQVILDLEDSVVESEKAAARLFLSQHFASSKFTKKHSIRVNELNTPESAMDLDLIANIDPTKLASIIVPKAHSLDTILNWAKFLPSKIGIEAQIESAQGLIAAPDIASHPQVISLAFGPVDFMHSVGMPSVEPGIPSSLVPSVLQWPLMQVIIAAHAHGKLAYDGPCLKINDKDEFIESAKIARALGGDGKWLIHPNQIEMCNEIFSPTEADIKSAQDLIRSFESSSGAVAHNGVMIDEASRKLAEQLLERVTQIRR